MKTITHFFWLLFWIFAIQAQGATVIVTDDITQQAVDDIFGEYSPAFIAKAQAGGTSGAQGHELELSAEDSIQTYQVDWDFPDPVFLFHDGAGNVGIQSGSSGGTENLIEDQPLFGFNTVIIHLSDIASFPGGASFTGIEVNGVEIRDMFANEGDDWVMIQFDEESPEFQLTGEVEFINSGGSDAFVSFHAFNVDSIPEPSVPMFLLPLFSILLHRRR